MSESSNAEAANIKTIAEKIAIAIEKVMTLRITTVVGLVTATNAADHMGLDIQLPAGPHECATTTVDLLQGDITQIRTEKFVSDPAYAKMHDDALTVARQTVADNLAALRSAIIGLEKFLPRP